MQPTSFLPVVLHAQAIQSGQTREAHADHEATQGTEG